jgi:hypothetical protein
MSERLKSDYQEYSEQLSEKEYLELTKRNHERLKQASEKSHETSKETIDDILKRIEKEARTVEELTRDQEKIERINRHDLGVGVGSHLKNSAFEQTLERVRRQLPVHQRIFSKIIHKPAIDNASQVIGASIARPSGLLFGGLFSLIFSVLAIFISRYFGYEYNFTISLLGFLGGFFLGLLFELLIRSIRRP